MHDVLLRDFRKKLLRVSIHSWIFSSLTYMMVCGNSGISTRSPAWTVHQVHPNGSEAVDHFIYGTWHGKLTYFRGHTA